MNTEQIRRIVNQKWFLPSATAVGGAIFGYAVGYMRTKAQYEHLGEELKAYEARTDKVVEELSQATTQLQEKWTPRFVEDHPPLDEAAHQALMEDHPSSKRLKVDLSVLEPEKKIEKVTDIRKLREEPVEDVKTTRNIFDTAGDEWDYKTEIQNRIPTAPYVIHVDEYVNDEKGWDNQSTLTWYELDQVLCDTHDTPIFNHSEVVGDMLFGHGSNDPNVFYVRNEKLQAEYEILRDTRSYQEVVLGEKYEAEAEKDELRHSVVSKFRPE